MVAGTQKQKLTKVDIFWKEVTNSRLILASGILVDHLENVVLARQPTNSPLIKVLKFTWMGRDF